MEEMKCGLEFWRATSPQPNYTFAQWGPRFLFFHKYVAVDRRFRMLPSMEGGLSEVTNTNCFGHRSFHLTLHFFHTTSHDKGD